MTRLALLALLVAAPAWAAPAALCDRAPRVDCVVDGDTFWRGGVKIRLLGIDAPETGRARCAAERVKAKAATARLAELLGTGPVAVDQAGRDRFGRVLATVKAAGRDVGAVLVGEGLAVKWRRGQRYDWCAGRP